MEIWGTKRVKIAISLAILVFVVLSFVGTADEMGQEYTDAGFKRALVTFATARAINGVISVAQGTEVAIQPGGIGAVLTPGEILDPINDLIEQFSQVMLFSAAVLGTQKLLIEISGWFWFSILLTAALFSWLAALWLPLRIAPKAQQVLLAVAGILLIARFLVPLAAIANEAIFDLFLATRYEVATQHLEAATGELDSEDITTSNVEPAGNDRSLRGAAESFYESVKTRTDVSNKIEELKSASNKVAEEVIDLIVLFMVQTLLIPLLFAWLGYVGAKRLACYALEG